jgi:hypothetical protein
MLDRIKKTIKKSYSLLRDSVIVDILNKFNFSNTAMAYNWLTTSTQDSIVLSLAGQLGISSVQSKYLILLIISFIF